MARSDIELDFPRLIGKEYDLSDEDFNYNCLAYALGDLRNWWEPPRQPGQYWPPGFAADVTVSTVESIIRLSGYTVEIDTGAKPENEAIAIYAKGSEWTHFAKFVGGKWSSKLGDGHDVTGVLLEDLQIPLYGRVVKILCRPANPGQ